MATSLDPPRRASRVSEFLNSTGKFVVLHCSFLHEPLGLFFRLCILAVGIPLFWWLFGVLSQFAPLRWAGLFVMCSLVVFGVIPWRPSLVLWGIALFVSLVTASWVFAVLFLLAVFGAIMKGAGSAPTPPRG